MKKSIQLLLALSTIFSLNSQTQTQNLNMGLHELQFSSASGGSNRIQSYGGTYPGTWLFKSRFDDIYLDAGENSNNLFDIVFKTGGIERARVDRTGNLGVGTIHPNSPLTIGYNNDSNQLAFERSDGSETFTININNLNEVIFKNHSGSGNYDFRSNINGLGVTSAFFIKGYDGNIGIGTTSPNSKLDIVGGALRLSHSSNQRLEISQDKNTDGTVIFDNQAAIGDMKFQFSGTNNMVIKRNGNIGVGTTSPQLKFHIKDPSGGAAYGVERGGKLWRWDIQNTGDKIWFGNTDAPNLYEYGNQGTFQVSTEYSTLEKAKVYVRGNGTRHDGVTPNLVSGGLVSGNTDNAKFGKFNVALESWFGIGFRSSFNNKEGIVFNTRTASAFFEGNVGVGTDDTKGFKLGVQGKIAAEEVKVAAYDNWSDFVFNDSYTLPSLREVENHIKNNGHLENIPSAKQVAENGFFLAEMDSKLLQKIEELTLYTINQEKRIESLETKNKKLIALVEKLLAIKIEE